MKNPEAAPSRLTRGAAIIALSTAALAGACSAESPSAPQIPRCSAQAQPEDVEAVPTPPEMPSPPRLTHNESAAEFLKSRAAFKRQMATYKKKWDTYITESDGGPLLTLPVDDHGVAGDPGALDHAIDERVKGATVLVAAPNWHGTGFLAKDSAGRTKLITAMHVIGNQKLSAITVTDQQGHSTHPVSGCYTYEKDGKQIPFQEELGEQVVDIDVAALTLKTKIGTSALTLAVHPPKRGQWVFYNNYQGQDAKVKHSSSYTGLLTSVQKNQIIALTGLQSERHAAGADNYINGPGASGGAVVNNKGEVVGESYASGKWYKGPEELRGSPFRIVLTGQQFGDATGLLPTQSFLVSDGQLRDALNSAH
ncbi:MAG TPA: trypsin-like peptidase domain-containing protein [Candidatus Saccharimonadales bacterium]|nr:trypsin-like peptidase domain-containing protein [Candidatus Saccharimonadales bacterium]